MIEKTGGLGELRARLAEVEPGLFKAEYIEADRARSPDSVSIPDSHIGTDRDGVRMWVEQMAQQMGYSAVRWE